jgi:hypothetical protein
VHLLMVVSLVSIIACLIEVAYPTHVDVAGTRGGDFRSRSFREDHAGPSCHCRGSKNWKR